MPIRYKPHADPLFQRKLNSLTQYPSIPTYHKLSTGGKGRLTEELSVRFDGPLQITEKVDGTNARMVFLPGGMWFIGGRTEWLTARDDIVFNPKNNIVDNLGYFASTMETISDYRVVVIYAEVYGGGTGANWKNYTTKADETRHRIFDAFTMGFDEFDEHMNRPIEQIAAWRDAGGQPYMRTTEIIRLAAEYGLALVPPIDDIKANKLPTGLVETEEWLKKLLPETRAAFGSAAKNVAEGVVIRSPGREAIAKLRFEDYARAARIVRQETLNAASAARRKTPKPLKRTIPN